MRRLFDSEGVIDDLKSTPEVDLTDQEIHDVIHFGDDNTGSVDKQTKDLKACDDLDDANYNVNNKLIIEYVLLI